MRSLQALHHPYYQIKTALMNKSVKPILDKILSDKLDGKVSNKKEELTFAEKLSRQRGY